MIAWQPCRCGTGQSSGLATLALFDAQHYAFRIDYRRGSRRPSSGLAFSLLAELRIEPHCRQRFAELVQQRALMPEKAHLHELRVMLPPPRPFSCRNKRENGPKSRAIFLGSRPLAISRNGADA